MHGKTPHLISPIVVVLGTGKLVTSDIASVGGDLRHSVRWDDLLHHTHDLCNTVLNGTHHLTSPIVVMFRTGKVITPDGPHELTHLSSD